MKDEPQKAVPKKRLHPRNKHINKYDLDTLKSTYPSLVAYTYINKYNNQSIDFSNPKAVLALNTAILMHHYGISIFEIPPGYLCPAIPGRADYIHYAADLLSSSLKLKSPNGPQIKCLDIGVGASCIYPIIGHSVYQWSFVGSDIDDKAILSAKNIIDSNSILNGRIDIRKQHNHHLHFSGIIKKGERFALTICNPPFHSSKLDAEKSSYRKIRNLKNKKNVKLTLNFGGTANELWTEGGEKRFIANMMNDSKHFASSCLWFSTLVSKESLLKFLIGKLKSLRVSDYKVIAMGQGNKSSRILAWTYIDNSARQMWAKRLSIKGT